MENNPFGLGNILGFGVYQTHLQGSFMEQAIGNIAPQNFQVYEQLAMLNSRNYYLECDEFLTKQIEKLEMNKKEYRLLSSKTFKSLLDKGIIMQFFLKNKDYFDFLVSEQSQEFAAQPLGEKGRKIYDFLTKRYNLYKERTFELPMEQKEYDNFIKFRKKRDNVHQILCVSQNIDNPIYKKRLYRIIKNKIAYIIEWFLSKENVRIIFEKYIENQLDNLSNEKNEE